ncbi:hypothetical protein CPB85DRAFT_1258293 [Mucidula mucida]|nr:hypothetical protein CPB85DRAFT_1258293 [Mucidula mucida]
MFPSRRYAAIMLADVLDIFRDLHSAVLSTVLVMSGIVLWSRNIRTDHGDQNTNSSASIRKLQCYEFDGSTLVFAWYPARPPWSSAISHRDSVFFKPFRERFDAVLASPCPG